MRIASIDIGTNTLLMLIADVADSEPTRLHVVEDHHRIVRLGEGLLAGGTISSVALRRAESCLQDYATRCAELRVDRLAAVATSAVRRAANQADVLQRLSSALGSTVRCISGDEEADMVLLGSREGFDDVCLIDIGGGSTEIIRSAHDRVVFRHSLETGAVRLREQYLTRSPVDTATEQQTSDHVESLIRLHLQSLQAMPAPPMTIAVAGTPTSLATLAMDAEHFDADRVHGFSLTNIEVHQLWHRLRACTLEELKALPGVHPDRVDILPAGTFILLHLMKRLSIPAVRVSTRGLRYGVAIRAADVQSGF